jgi:hypothetical protein
VPALGGLGELSVDVEPGTVGVDPATQPWPGTEQGLVGDLGGVLVRGDQAGVGEGIEHGRCRGRVRRVRDQCVPVGTQAGVRHALADLDHAQQQPAGGLLPGGAESLEHGFGRGGDRTADASGGLVTGHGQHAIITVFPGGLQGMGQQR